MFQKLFTYTIAVGLGLSTAILVIPQKAEAFSFFIARNSIDCDQIFTGIGGPDILATGEVVCAVRITKILRACTMNPGGGRR